MSEWISAILLVIGSAFMLLAGVGVVRMPDLFSRMQAAAKATMLGVGCQFLAVAIYYPHVAITARALLVIGFILLTGPISAHMIARAAYSSGVPLWHGTVQDDLRRHHEEGKSNISASEHSAEINEPGG